MNNIPKELPTSDLIEALSNRAATRRDTSFPFLARLDDFRGRVSDEVQFINQLFPEYTPHDAKYHLSRLFHVADKCLTEARLAGMNSAELFVLACGLYGHDWGMAISRAEKAFILSGELAIGATAEEYWILGDEHTRFEEFAKQHGLLKDPKTGYSTISVELWRSYVRNTHATRSAERARRYFQSSGEGVSEAVARVCEGHWLEFSSLRNENYFPQDFSVLGESVNLRAIAVYIRLIDLLDIANDRTPYAIWKFVAPKDSTSRMEWNKHRALQPVTFPTYQQGRVIQFDGSTDDHEVFAALEDLKDYCEDQLKECKDILAQMNDPRHFLDIYHISWRIATRGFKTPSMRFEFDRKRMFEILGDQIYRGNPYVFLRELLQNSIDAIRMRRKALASRNLDPGELGTIHVTIEHKNNGDVGVTWTDDGSGMDEYIVRNFLGVAGKSYYSSREFSQLGLTFDPISKFGIGILSCFLVADRIEIETHRDSYLTPNSVPLRICIPDVEKHFRVEYGKSSAPFGTTVRVFVKAEKLKAAHPKQNTENFEATEYLSRIAGFVEFPIVVKDGEQTSIILHPERPLPRRLEATVEQGASVRRLELGIALESHIAPQDVSDAKKYLREERFSIEADLKLAGYQGAMSYLIPVSDDLDWDADSDALILRDKPRRFKAVIRPAGISSSSESSLPEPPSNGAVFRDGILVERTENARYSFLRGRWKQRLLTNLTHSLNADIDVSRTCLIGESKNWKSVVDEALLEFFGATWAKRAMNLDPEKRLVVLARACTNYGIGTEKLWKVCSQEKWPITALGSDGNVVVAEWSTLKNKPLATLPAIFGSEAASLLWQRFVLRSDYKGPLVEWVGDLAAIRSYDWFSNNIPEPGFLRNIVGFCSCATEGWRKSIRFVRGPWEKGPDLLQEILVPGNSHPAVPDETQSVLRMMASDVASITEEILDDRSIMDRFGDTFAVFPEPHSKAFAYGWERFNLNHPVSKQLLNLMAVQRIALLDEKLTSAQRGELADIGDIASELEETSAPTKSRMNELQRVVTGVSDLLTKFGLRGTTDAPVRLPGSDEFVSGTFGTTGIRGGRGWLSRSPDQKFGQPLV